MTARGIDAFQEEATEYMAKFGYSPHYKSGTNSSIIFWNCDEILKDNCPPSIECYINERNEKVLKLSNVSKLKMFLQICSNELPMYHHDLKRYIEVMSHYSKVCDTYKPW